MICRLCERRIKDWVGDDARCAFNSDGTFAADNWNCEMMNRLRKSCEDSLFTGSSQATLYTDDQTLGVHARDGKFLILGWYKSRGAVESAFVVDGSITRKLNYAEAESFL